MKLKFLPFVIITLVFCAGDVDESILIEEVKNILSKSELTKIRLQSFDLKINHPLDTIHFLSEYKENLETDSTVFDVYIHEDGDTAEAKIVNFLSGEFKAVVTDRVQRDSSIIWRKFNATVVQYAQLYKDNGSWKFSKISYQELLSDSSSARLSQIELGKHTILSPAIFYHIDSLPSFNFPLTLKVKGELDTSRMLVLLRNKNYAFILPSGEDKDIWVKENFSSKDDFCIQAISKKTFLEKKHPYDINGWIMFVK